MRIYRRCDRGTAIQVSQTYFLIEEKIEDRECLSELARISVKELPMPKPKKKKKG